MEERRGVGNSPGGGGRGVGTHIAEEQERPQKAISEEKIIHDKKALAKWKQEG